MRLTDEDAACFATALLIVLILALLGAAFGDWMMYLSQLLDGFNYTSMTH